MNLLSYIRKMLIFLLNSGITGGLDTDAVRKIRLLNISSYICAIFLVPLSIKSFILGNYFLFSVDLIVMTLFLFSFCHIKRTSRYDIASHVVIHSLLVLLLSLVYTGGVEKTGPVWIFIFPMAAFFLYGLKRGLVYTIIFTVGISLFLLFGLRIANSADYLPIFRIRTFASYLAVALFTLLYETVRENNFQKMKQVSEKLDDISKRDPLTCLLNRRGMFERLEYESERSKRNKISFSVLMGDIDNFKTVNDENGHDAGDYVLTRLSTELNVMKRAQDLIARWGGEEFLLLLPETDLKGALVHAEKIRKTIEGLNFTFEGRELNIMMSFGAAEIEPNKSPCEGITEADRNLMVAKSSGRNKVMPVFGS